MRTFSSNQVFKAPELLHNREEIGYTPMISDLAVAHSHDINSFVVNFSTRWRHTEKHSMVRSMIRFIGRHQLAVRGLPMDICVKIGQCVTKSVIWATLAIFVRRGVRL